MADYLDTSAFLKLVRAESGSEALRASLGHTPKERVSSALLRTEGQRAAARYGPAMLRRARVALATVTLMALDDAVLDAAASLEPPEMRSLDAIHLASALELGDELDRFYCYDARLARAAASRGLNVVAPG